MALTFFSRPLFLLIPSLNASSDDKPSISEIFRNDFDFYLRKKVLSKIFRTILKKNIFEIFEKGIDKVSKKRLKSFFAKYAQKTF